MTSQFINENIQNWRARCASGEHIPADEMQQIIDAIRKERAMTEAAPKPRARATATAKPKRQKPEDVNSDDLLKELGL